MWKEVVCVPFALIMVSRCVDQITAELCVVGSLQLGHGNSVPRCAYNSFLGEVVSRCPDFSCLNK